MTNAEASSSEELAAQLRPVVTKLSLVLRREAPPTELSMAQATVLATLSQDGPARVTALANAMHVRQPSMTSLLNRLEGYGWIRRTRDTTDQRALLVELTSEGECIVGRAASNRTEVLARRLAGLSHDDVGAIASALPALRRLVGRVPELTVE